MLVDQFEATMKASMTPAKIKAFERDVAVYIDRNADVLMRLNMSIRYSFGDTDREKLYTLTNVTEDQMTTAIGMSSINKTNKMHNNPFYVTSILAAHVVASNKNHMKTILSYMMMNMYTSAHRGSFKYPPNEAIMDYTIAHLDKSFRITEMQSILDIITDIVETIMTTYKSRFTKCSDADITYIIDAAWTRIKGRIIKIATQYYKNHQSGKYLYAETDEAEVHEINNDSFIIDGLANRIYLKLLNNQVNDKFIRYAISSTNISERKLQNLLDDIIQGDTEGKVKDMVALIIESYLTMSNNPISYIGKGDFIVFMKSLYNSNTTNPAMLKVKAMLDEWMKDHMVTLGRTNYSKSSMTYYKKAVFMYMVMVINAEAKGMQYE